MPTVRCRMGRCCMSGLFASRTSAVLGAELTESQAALRVFLAAGGLVVAGLSLLVLTIWWWRHTRPEPPALGPLEVMGDRKWATAADSERRRLIEEFRPVGAEPSNRIVDPQPVDLSVLARDAPRTFDDLREPMVDPEALEIATSSAVEVEASEPIEPVEPGEPVLAGAQAEPPAAPVDADLGGDLGADLEGATAKAETAFTSLSEFPLPAVPATPHAPAMPVMPDASDDLLRLADGDDTVAMVEPELPVSPNVGS